MINCDESVSGGRPIRVERGGIEKQEPNRPEEKEESICGEKCNESLRLLTNNINSLGQETGSTKERELKEFLTENKIDIAGIQ